MLKRSLLLLLLGLIAVLIQGVILNRWFPSFIVPNLIVIMVVYLALREQNSWAVLMCFFLGLILDFSTGKLLGPWAGASVVSFVLVTIVSTRMFLESWLVNVVAVAVGAIIASSVYLLLELMFYPIPSRVPITLLVETIVTAACGPFVFQMLSYFLETKEHSFYNRSKYRGRT